MKIKVQIIKDYELSEHNLNEFIYRCFEYSKIKYEDCAIKSADDIPVNTIRDLLTDFISDILSYGLNSCEHEGVILDDYFNTISFDFCKEIPNHWVVKCVQSILTDIDYEPKFKQLLELSDNLKTGCFGEKDTKYSHNGFELYSQTASIKVQFTPMTLCWTIRIYSEEDGEEVIRSGIGWNALIQYLCVKSDLTWFCYMSDEDIQKCKLWKERV